MDQFEPNLAHLSDSSGNGHRLKIISSSRPQGAFVGGLGGQKFKHLDNLPNDWTDWHQIWYTPVDSSRNGHRLNTISPSIPQRALGGGGEVIGGYKFKHLDNLPNDGTAALLRMEGGIILLIATCILHEINSSVVVIVFMFIYVCTTV